MAIFSLIAKLGLDGTAFEGGLKRSQSMAKGIGKEIGATMGSIFAVDKLAQFGMQAIETAGQISDLSSQLGVSAEFLQEMKFAAEMGGASLEDVAGALEKLSIARQKALAGDKATVENLQKFGITIDQLRSMNLESMFFGLGKPFSEGIDPQKLLGPFRELAGKSAGALIPAMTEGLQDAAEQARNLGLVMEDEVIASLEDVADRLDILKAKMTAGTGTFTTAVIVPIQKYTEALYAAVEGFLLASSTPAGTKELPAREQMRNMFDQAEQAFISSIEEQERDVEARTEKRKRRSEIRRKSLGEDKTTGFEVSRMQPTDALARTGGFTAFQSSLDKYFGPVRSQAQDISDIARNTRETADAVKE
jgi:hypothetical protein